MQHWQVVVQRDPEQPLDTLLDTEEQRDRRKRTLGRRLRLLQGHCTEGDQRSADGETGCCRKTHSPVTPPVVSA